jgi:hypothetical protein
MITTARDAVRDEAKTVVQRSGNSLQPITCMESGAYIGG